MAGTDDTGNRYRIASLQPDIDRRDMFARLTKEAERGDVVGAVVICLRKRRGHEPHYHLTVSGQAASRPTYALGAVDACSLLLRELALKNAGLR